MCGEMYEKTRAAGFGPEVKRRILIGTLRAFQRLLRRLLRQGAEGTHAIAADFERAFAQCDVIASPAASSPAFTFNAKSDPYSMYLMDYYTIPVSLAGLPSLSVPCGWALPEGGTRRCRSACSSAARCSPNARCWVRARLRTGDAACTH